MRDILIDKHPPQHIWKPLSRMSPPPPPPPPTIHLILFEPWMPPWCYTSDSWCSRALRNDTYVWRRLCISFKSASNEEWLSLAAVAKCLCTCLSTSNVSHPAIWLPSTRTLVLTPSISVRWIIAKAVFNIIREDIAAGSLQLCAGHISGIEAAVHAVHILPARGNWGSTAHRCK